jgi:hypothetical protein
MRDYILGVIVVLWGGAMLLRAYLQTRKNARAKITAEIKRQFGEQPATKVVASKLRLSAPRLVIDSPLFGSFGVGQSGAEEAQRALQSLNGVVVAKFDPADPHGVQEAIRQYDREIDARLVPYPQNKVVAETARKLKSDFRELVQKRVQRVAHSATERK